MRIRIRLSKGPIVHKKRHKNQRVALALASLMTPAAVMACVLGFWRLAADLKVTGEFPITDGLFSHWQVWLSLAAVVQFTATVLNRYGNSEPVIQETVEETRPTLLDSRW